MFDLPADYFFHDLLLPSRRNKFPFFFNSNGIWSCWQYFFRLGTERNSVSVPRRKKNSQHDHIPFNLERDINRFLRDGRHSVWISKIVIFLGEKKLKKNVQKLHRMNTCLGYERNISRFNLLLLIPTQTLYFWR